MASGDQVVEVIRELPPASSYAVDDVRAGGSTPAEAIAVVDFDAATVMYRDYLCRLSGYGGGGLTFTLPWMASAATSGSVRWGVAIRRIQDDAESVANSHSYDFNEVDDPAPSAAGEVSYPTVAFADGADMDDWADGELAIVRVRRNATDVNDDMTGDAELLGIVGRET